MALVYNFGDKVISNPNKVRQSGDAVRQALLQAHCSPEHADQFLADLNGHWGTIIEPALTAVSTAVLGPVKGKATLWQLKQNHKILSKVFAATVIGPQFKFQASSFKLAVHKKGQNIQLWMSYGGAPQVLVNTPPPA